MIIKATISWPINARGYNNAIHNAEIEIDNKEMARYITELVKIGMLDFLVEK